MCAGTVNIWASVLASEFPVRTRLIKCAAQASLPPIDVWLGIPQLDGLDAYQLYFIFCLNSRIVEGMLAA